MMHVHMLTWSLYLYNKNNYEIPPKRGPTKHRTFLPPGSATKWAKLILVILSLSCDSWGFRLRGWSSIPTVVFHYTIMWFINLCFLIFMPNRAQRFTVASFWKSIRPWASPYLLLVYIGSWNTPYTAQPFARGWIQWWFWGNLGIWRPWSRSLGAEQASSACTCVSLHPEMDVIDL